jgi:cytochrome P450
LSSIIDAVPLADADLPFLDLRSEAWAKNPWAEARRVREQDLRGGRLARSDRGIEVFGYADFTSIMGDKRLQTLHTSHWEEQGAGPMTLDFVDNGHLLTFDTERHLRVRRIMTAAFRLSHIEQQRAWFHELARGLIETFVGRGSCDLVEEFSHRYSMSIICRMIGVPAEDIPAFERATIDMALMNAYPLQPVVPQLEAALKTIWDYSTEIVARRRAQPQEDFISGMIVAQESEGKLTEHETVWAVANLLFAGHDTTRYQLAAAVRALIDAGAWEQLAAAPELSAVAVEETIRLFPVVQLTSRVVVADDVVVDGVHMPPNTILRCNWFAFNRDPERFPDPDRLDLHRDDIKGRVPFGIGVHKCLGHALARADIEVALEELSSHLTDMEIAGDVPLQPFTGAMGGPKALPVRFRRRA